MAAPIAQTEDDWDPFTDFNSSQEFAENIVGGGKLDGNGNKELSGGEESIENLISDSGMVSYKSVEDLVHTFDERLASCFRLSGLNDGGDSEDEIVIGGLPKTFDVGELKKNAIWRQLTDNYGLVQPLDWENSTVRKLHLPALKLQCVTVDEPCENINENELKQQLDFHRMVEYNIYSEPSNGDGGPLFFSSSQEQMQTADEVIREIEEMMTNANEADAAVDLQVQDATGIVFDADEMLSVDDDNSVTDLTEDSFEAIAAVENAQDPKKKEAEKKLELDEMSLSDLNKQYNEISDKIRVYSSQLLTDLSRRDELKYEIETKRLFISHVVEVQYAQEKFRKEHNTLGKFKRSTTMDSIPKAGLYLTTVIPYNRYPKPSVEDLEILIKILEAIKNDSDEVPNLLTSYILNVICPAPSENELKL